MKIQDLKKGQIVWECERGMNHELLVVSDPRRVENRKGYHDGWEADAEYQGRPVHLYCADIGGAYGPRLYKCPQYA